MHPLCGIISDNAEGEWERGIKIIDGVNINPTDCALTKGKKLSEKNMVVCVKPEARVKNDTIN